jgi:HJR/Mrr/RecB family endonuclease
MADYDFRSLSPFDFELLCRDLLQKHLGVYLESFSIGRDQGIDLRAKPEKENIIVQCKHYADSGFTALIHSINPLHSRSAPKTAL